MKRSRVNKKESDKNSIWETLEKTHKCLGGSC